MNRKELLDKAKQITQERGYSYGSPDDNFQSIADTWTAYTGFQFKPADVCAMMIIVKIMRLKADLKHQDSWIDIAGYAALASEVINNEASVHKEFTDDF